MSCSYGLNDFDVVTFKCLKSDSERCISAKNWILSMSEPIDEENGVSFWQWIEENDELSTKNQNNLMNTFFLFFHNQPNQAVATGTIASDDQDMGKILSLEQVVWIGGINIHRDFRGHGIGGILFAYIDNYIQQMIKTGITVCLFTQNAKAKHIYKRFAFKSKGFIKNGSLVENDPTVRESILIFGSIRFKINKIPANDSHLLKVFAHFVSPQRKIEEIFRNLWC
ncbi:unnamed protein product [Rotaria magnacalcarata]|uniref:N-acetyltransferase domain-containing protein n=1 Tax=Rotaria magnacalcarata TaxID=392030 RepID=A0A816LL72_9BILA|nr:unnamed protein product [Rotaria magnacalcarata]